MWEVTTPWGRLHPSRTIFRHIEGPDRGPVLEEPLRKCGDMDEERWKIEALIPIGHTGDPDDIAYGVLDLASDESKFVTGTDRVIASGYPAW
jgi:NAD(P)-dependent dehydrogenase (short-subunit alcohol dehydrogenase family)